MHNADIKKQIKALVGQSFMFLWLFNFQYERLHIYISIFTSNIFSVYVFTNGKSMIQSRVKKPGFSAIGGR